MKVFLRDSWPLALLVLTIVFMLWQFPHKAIIFSPKIQNSQEQSKPFASFVSLTRREYNDLLRKAGISWKAKVGVRVSSAMASDAGPALSDPLPKKEYMSLPKDFYVNQDIAPMELPSIENHLLPRSFASPEIGVMPTMKKKRDEFLTSIANELKNVPAILENDFNKRKGENNDDRTRGIGSFYAD
jgi:hypothetical protein